MKYDVNVRAVVNASVVDAEAIADAEGWDIYDISSIERDDNDRPTRVEVRCDQLVSVDADNDAEAVETAKSLATPIVMEGFEIDGVTLWVDEGIDVTPAADADASVAPSP